MAAKCAALPRAGVLDCLVDPAITRPRTLGKVAKAAPTGRSLRWGSGTYGRGSRRSIDEMKADRISNGFAVVR
jgi:hypothetical protein